MKIVKDVSELAEIYEEPVERALRKVSPIITPLYRQWILESRFLVIATVGAEGCDCSPRGDIENLVYMPNDGTIWLPDWSGNNRLDSLRNIVGDGRVSLMFMVNGCNNVVRVNGTAVLATEDHLLAKFLRKGKLPRSVIVVKVSEIYFQCAKALMRSDLWNDKSRKFDLPTAGDFSKEQDENFDSVSYDKGYIEYAKSRLW